MPIDVMPGADDPSNVALPQQPMHRQAGAPGTGTRGRGWGLGFRGGGGGSQVQSGYAVCPPRSTPSPPSLRLLTSRHAMHPQPSTPAPRPRLKSTHAHAHTLCAWIYVQVPLPRLQQLWVLCARQQPPRAGAGRGAAAGHKRAEHRGHGQVLQVRAPACLRYSAVLVRLRAVRMCLLLVPTARAEQQHCHGGHAACSSSSPRWHVGAWQRTLAPDDALVVASGAAAAAAAACASQRSTLPLPSPPSSTAWRRLPGTEQGRGQPGDRCVGPAGTKLVLPTGFLALHAFTWNGNATCIRQGR